MRVIYCDDKDFRQKNGRGQCPDLTDGKAYDAVDVVELSNGMKYYELVEDDSDEQEFYPVEIFDVI